MTLTLQDAQLISRKIFRKINDMLDAEKGKSLDPFAMASHLLKEAGRVTQMSKVWKASSHLKNAKVTRC